MGIGKFLHRKKGDTPSPQHPNRQSRAVSQGDADNALGTSRYEATAPGSSPETGAYPIKGNNNTAAVTSRKGSIRDSMDRRGNQSSRPDTAPAYPAASTAPRLQTPPNSDFSDYHFFDQPQTSTQTRTQTTTTTTVSGRPPRTQKMNTDTGLARNFSDMSMNDDPTEASAIPSPISYYPNSGSGRLDPRVDSPPRNDQSVKMVNAPTPHQPYKTPNNYQRGGPGYYDKASRPPTAAEGLSARPKDVNRHDNTGGLVGGFDRGHNDSNETDVRRRDSIPRKQVSTSGHTPSGSVTSGSPTTAWPSTESWDQQAPPVPQHYMPLSQQPRYQAPTAAPHQHSSSSRQTQSNVPSRQQDRHEEPPPRTSSSTYKPQQLKHSMPHSQHASHQDSPSPTQQYDHARSAQSPSQHEVHPDYALDRQYDGRVAPLAIRSKHASKNVARGPAPEDVVERAKTNTYDTEVIEKIAPAVVQETVQKKVHHVREEVITREVHTHDVFHRILPVIDVEVLPPRHFLPVEGGGLVEIGADEVPGRGHNWVIAETASKIPSDQPAPKGISRFTARQFPGTEGDAVEYIDREGVEHTETTWVHPPELETGARDTGQTWPMTFGKDSPTEGRVRSQGPSPSKSAKSRSRKRSSISRATGAAPESGHQYTSAS